MNHQQIGISFTLATVAVANVKHVVSRFQVENALSVIGALFLAFHTVAFMVSFLHWFLDTWTVQNDDLRKRTFNQAKTHHFYPFLVVEKEFFARNDDSIYSALVTGSLLFCTRQVGIKLSVFAEAFWCSMMLSMMVSLEIHRYAHINIHEVPWPLRLLQKTNFLLSKESHMRHHNGGFNRSYDLMSGWMNLLVDFLGIYPFLEWCISRTMGWQPRSYLENAEEKQELEEYFLSHS